MYYMSSDSQDFSSLMTMLMASGMPDWLCTSTWLWAL